MRRILIFAFLLLQIHSGWGDTLLVIVHPDVRADKLDQRQLRNLYLLKQNSWPDGTPIIPLNLPATSKQRSLFFEKVLKIDMQTAANIWLQMHFRGRQPPHVVSSPQAAVTFTSRVKGAISYIPAGTETPEVKVVARFHLEDSQ